MVIMMLRSSIRGTARRSSLLGQEFPDQTEGAHGESDLAQEDSLDSDESDDSEEQRDEGGHLKLEEEEEGQQLLDLLLLLATGWK